MAFFGSPVPGLGGDERSDPGATDRFLPDVSWQLDLCGHDVGVVAKVGDAELDLEEGSRCEGAELVGQARQIGEQADAARRFPGFAPIIVEDQDLGNDDAFRARLQLAVSTGVFVVGVVGLLQDVARFGVEGDREQRILVVAATGLVVRSVVGDRDVDGPDLVVLLELEVDVRPGLQKI